MPIEQKKCKCGCGRAFYGTERRKFYCDYCRVKWNRQQAKLKGKNDEQ